MCLREEAGKVFVLISSLVCYYEIPSHLKEYLVWNTSSF